MSEDAKDAVEKASAEAEDKEFSYRLTLTALALAEVRRALVGYTVALRELEEFAEALDIGDLPEKVAERLRKLNEAAPDDT